MVTMPSAAGARAMVSPRRPSPMRGTGGKGGKFSATPPEFNPPVNPVSFQFYTPQTVTASGSIIGGHLTARAHVP